MQYDTRIRQVFHKLTSTQVVLTLLHDTGHLTAGPIWEGIWQIRNVTK